MPYIGRGISQLQTIDKLDAITPSTSTGAGPYNLTQSSSAFTPISANNLLISINGVVQYGNFTVSGSTVTFTGALSDSDTCNFILHVGEGVVNTPGAGTVTSSSIADGSIVGDDINSTFDISSKTVTLPASVSGLGTGITNAQLAGSIANSKLANSSITINGSSVSLGGSTTIETGTSWQSSVKTSTFTAAAGEGYFINTSGGAFEVDLPGSPSVGDVIEFVDFSRSFGTNALTLDQGSLKFQGNTSPKPIYNTNGQGIRIVYSGTTQGWIPTSDDDVTLETPQTYSAEMLIVAGGGAGGSSGHGGGGGAGGYRTSTQSLTQGSTYTITVGAGGSGGTDVGGSGVSGSDSSISGTGITTITSAGGGGGAKSNDTAAASGGSGGGGAGSVTGTGGSGNTPSTSPSQGNNGGNHSHSAPSYPTGGGGGASAVGANGSGHDGGDGGAGTSNSITGSAVSYAGGGGGSTHSDGSGNSPTQGSGGAGGGGAGAKDGNATSGTANLGGGGGSSSGDNNGNSGNGGSGVVILRVLTADYSGTTTGSPTVTTDGSHKVIKFTGDGSYTA